MTQYERMRRAGNRRETGGAVALVLAGAAVVIAAVALIVALSRGSSTARSTASRGVTTTTLDPRRVCQAKLTAYENQWRYLNEEREALQSTEQKLKAQLTAELAAHSPNADATDAAHHAAQRDETNLQQQILHLEALRAPGSSSC
jgi:hypothetical protein